MSVISVNLFNYFCFSDNSVCLCWNICSYQACTAHAHSDRKICGVALWAPSSWISCASVLKSHTVIAVRCLWIPRQKTTREFQRVLVYFCLCFNHSFHVDGVLANVFHDVLCLPPGGVVGILSDIKCLHHFVVSLYTKIVCFVLCFRGSTEGHFYNGYHRNLRWG